MLVPRSLPRTCCGTLVSKDEARVKILNVPFNAAELRCEAAMHNAPVQAAPKQTLPVIVCAIAERRNAWRGTKCLSSRLRASLISNARKKIIFKCECLLAC